MSRTILAGVLLAAGLVTSQLVVPHNVFACSCARIGTLAEVAAEPGLYVLAGTIHDIRDGGGGQRATLAISRVYQGTLPSLSLPIRGGGGGDCTVDLRQATNVVMVARFENGTIEPGLCSPFADVSTPEGQRLLAEADATWPVPAAPIESSDLHGFDAVLAVILIVTPLLALVLIVAVVAFIRRRGADPEAS